MALVMGLDIATSKAVGVLVDTSSGRLLARHVVTYAPGFAVPEDTPGGAEHEASVWLDGAMRLCRECALAARSRRSRLEAVCVSGLSAGLGVPVDRDGHPLRPSIMWLDRRATREAEAVAGAVTRERLREVTGNAVIDPSQGFVKLVWFIAREPALYKQTRAILTPAGLVVRALAEVHATDVCTLADYGGLLDVGRWQVDDGMCEDLARVASGIAGERLEPPTHLFGRLVVPGDIVGEVTQTGSALSGLPTGLAVVAGGLDTATAMLASGATEPGDNTIVMGTSWTWGVLNRYEGARPVPRLVSVPYVVRPRELRFTFGGAAYIGGAASHWLPQMIAALPVDALDREAAMVPAGSEGLTFHPYLTGASGPLWRSDLTGAYIGLRAHHHRGHLYRAILESAAFIVDECARAVRGAGVELAPEATLVDAGGGSALWRRIVADVTRVPLRHLVAFPGTAYGTAMLAAIGARIVSEDEVRRWIPPPRPVRPTTDTAVLAAYDEARELFWSTQRALYGELRPSAAGSG